MLNPSNDWPDTPTARNMRLFAQLISHKAAVDTFESFRAMSLDSVSRIREAIEVLDGVEAGRPLESYKPVKEELIWSMERDPIFDLPSMSHVKKFIYHLKNDDKVSVPAVKAKLKVIDKLVSSSYRSMLEMLITKCVVDPSPARNGARHLEDARVANERSLALLASAYVSHLTSMGYSKAFIQHVTERYFFTRNVSRVRVSKLRSFFDQFDGNLSTFRVFLLVNSQAKDYLVGASDAEEVSVSDVPDAAREIIIDNIDRYTENSYVVSVKQRAVDMFSAAQIAFGRMRNYLSAAFVGFWFLDLSVTSEVVVATRNYGSAESVRVGHGDVATSRKVLADKRTAINRSVKDAQSLFETIDVHASKESRDRFHNAFATTHAASSSQNAETQLTSLWSAFEALLSPPPGSGSRISHYGKLVVPVICSHYAMRNCIYVSNTLILNERDSYREFIASMDDVGGKLNERYQYIAAAVSLPEFQPVYDDLILSFSDNRMMVNLLVSLKERFSNPKCFYEAIDQHEKKVSWQISRMYRARNQIVHAGLVPNFAESVAVNAFEYLSTVIMSMSAQINARVGISDIDTAIELISMNYYSSKEDVKRLSNSNRFGKANYLKAFASVA